MAMVAQKDMATPAAKANTKTGVLAGRAIPVKAPKVLLRSFAISQSPNSTTKPEISKISVWCANMMSSMAASACSTVMPS